MQRSADVAVIGGGAIGLSLAYELAGHGVRIRLLERGRVGREASWAGAGVLHAGSWFSAAPELAPLASLSRVLHADWSQQLREQTGIDDEHHACGGLYAATPDKLDWLEARFAAWRADGIRVEHLDAAETAEQEPAIQPTEAYFVPGDAQIRNPRRLAALREGCRQRGVVIDEDRPIRGFRLNGSRIDAALTDAGPLSAGAFCLAAGAWSGGLCEDLGVQLTTTPVRGQMALLRLPRRVLTSVCHVGGRYLVPRRDGRVLVGSTVEHAGFDTSTTDDTIQTLIQAAITIAPGLADAELEHRWAGLRPASTDELPLIGALPGIENGWIAAGHFRAGLQFSTGTAVALGNRIRGEAAPLNLSAFDPRRVASTPEAGRCLA